MASMIIRPATAFAMTGSRIKRPRAKDQDHLAFIRSLPCAVCGTRNSVHAAHIRTGNEGLGKRGVGFGEKPDDAWTIPACASCHLTGPNAQHSMNELAFWERHGINPFVLALTLFKASGDEEAAEVILRHARTP